MAKNKTVGIVIVVTVCAVVAYIVYRKFPKTRTSNGTPASGGADWRRERIQRRILPAAARQQSRRLNLVRLLDCSKAAGVPLQDPCPAAPAAAWAKVQI